VVPGRPSRANGRGGPRLAAGGARTLAPDCRGDLRQRGLDRQGELLAATEGGGVPPRPPSLEHGEDLDAAEGSP
jgi:hypothetical protein